MRKEIVLGMLILVGAPAAFGQTETKTKSSTEQIQYQNIVENGYTGNIVLDVVDENNVPVTNYQSILYVGDQEIFNVTQEGPRSVFYRDGSGVKLKIEKKGYQTYVSPPLTMDDRMEMACVLKIVLVKE